MSTRTALKAEFTIKTIEGRIKGLAQQLFKLAPHPTNPDHRGPLFISLNSSFKPAAEYDGMLGSLMLESFIGAAFSDAANDNSGASALTFSSQANFDALAEAASEYLEYRADQARGKGTFALGEHKTICNKFNAEGDDAVASYLRDLAQRNRIEATIQSLSQDFYTLKGRSDLHNLELYA